MADVPIQVLSTTPHEEEWLRRYRLNRAHLIVLSTTPHEEEWLRRECR